MQKHHHLIQNFKIYFLLAFCFVAVLLSCSEKVTNNNNNNNKSSISNNKIETYLSTWWYLPYTKGKAGDWGRPTYGIIDIDNGKLSLRHAILEGRELGDYRLPYWPINSFVSLYKNSLELAHRGSVEIGNKTIPFRCGDEKYRGNSLSNKRIEEGFELSHTKNADVLKVTNKGSNSQVRMEHYFVIEKGSSIIPVYVKATNITGSTFNNVVVNTSYSQDFNWSNFGIGTSKAGYKNVNAPVSGMTEAFFAYSSGMDSGFEFKVNKGCQLSYKLDEDFNTWHVSINNSPSTLGPGKSIVFSYSIKIIDKPLKNLTEHESISLEELELLAFNNIIPSEIKKTPVNDMERVSINDIIRDIDKPKVRGLHSIRDTPKAFEQLSLLKKWCGNLAVTPWGYGDSKKQLMIKGHELGIEMLMTGEGSFTTGNPPSFEKYFSTNPLNSEFPDSYGQDEDHHYWYPVKATLDFESEFGKPMSLATQKEKVKYWSRCFTHKWVKTLENIRKHHAEGKVWFYMPTPGVANVDPLDYYDSFFSEVSKLGDDLTILPFYYGTDYDQIEYMIKRWKNAAGASRVVFLPGGPTYLKPNQYFRAITAARRGGADGVCGFAFTITEDDFDEEWRWKSVLLASQCNFPTQELETYSLIEEPAELIEKLSNSDVVIYSKAANSDSFVMKLDKLIPGDVKLISEFTGKPSTKSGELNVIIGNDSEFIDKGIIRMTNNLIELHGTDDESLSNAKLLFLRFAELATAEKNN